jgi:chloramphenicol-sensitive protein RarD
MNSRNDRTRPSDPARRGLAFGLGAYTLWGVLPIYFKALAGVAPTDIVAHRIVWSLPFLAVLILSARQSQAVREAHRNRHAMGVLAMTATLIGINWLLYVYAVTSGHILAASLGYYLNPIANVLLGRFILKERLTAAQWIAVALALCGVLALAIGALGQLWISLALCVSFALYGLLRKVAPVESLPGLAVETALLFPLAIVWLAWGAAAGNPVFGTTTADAWLLTLAGIISTTPLLLFTAAARRLRYSTLGMLQFIAPTVQFILAVALYGERFTTAHAVAFGAIWVAIGIYVVSLLHQARITISPPE